MNKSLAIILILSVFLLIIPSALTLPAGSTCTKDTGCDAGLYCNLATLKCSSCCSAYFSDTTNTIKTGGAVQYQIYSSQSVNLHANILSNSRCTSTINNYYFKLWQAGSPTDINGNNILINTIRPKSIFPLSNVYGNWLSDWKLVNEKIGGMSDLYF